MKKILFSACLAGFPVRYNGSDKALICDQLEIWRRQNRLVVFCPELAAGFQTPRPPAEIQPTWRGNAVIALGAKVFEAGGTDVTERYILGAWLALEMALKHKCQFAILTDGSPSCGSNFIYSGNFSGHKTQGMGVTAELLSRHGIEVFSEHDTLRLCDRLAELC